MNITKRIGIALLFVSIAIIYSCKTDYTPKPNAYPRVHFPEATGKYLYNDNDCTYSFEVPDYYVVQKKTNFFEEDVSNQCWVNIICSDLNATIHISYKPLTKEQSLRKLVEEAYVLTYKHSSKADFIQPLEIDNGYGTVGLIYYVGGEAASNIQFFLTDTIQNFARGALYFYAPPNTDSLKPVVDFMILDIQEIIASWRWK